MALRFSDTALRGLISPLIIARDRSGLKTFGWAWLCPPHQCLDRAGLGESGPTEKEVRTPVWTQDPQLKKVSPELTGDEKGKGWEGGDSGAAATASTLCRVRLCVPGASVRTLCARLCLAECLCGRDCGMFLSDACWGGLVGVSACVCASGESQRRERDPASRWLSLKKVGHPGMYCNMDGP